LIDSHKQAGLLRRICHLALNAMVFGLCYLNANHLAQQNNITRHVALAFESSMPFIEWMIVLYLCSGIFFYWVFLAEQSAEALSLLSRRMLATTLIATALFMLVPLQFSWQRPLINSPIPAVLFDFLSWVDRPYNQFPSLHVAYCVIFWSSLRDTVQHRIKRLLLVLMLITVAVSTLFTYQHHLLDVIGGLIVGCVAVRMVRSRSSQPNVAFYYAIAAVVVFLVGVVVARSWVAMYLALSLALVSLAYLRNDRHFLFKRDGKHPFWIWLFYAPYLGGYRLTWQVVQYRERCRPAVVRVHENLLIGRRLTHLQARTLPKNCAVIDLSCELSETSSLRTSSYRHFPLLDLAVPSLDAMNEIADAIDQHIKLKQIVFLHCAMGYSRCVLLSDYAISRMKQ
jgi:membrane-associated phospholipid phosphatase